MLVEQLIFLEPGVHLVPIKGEVFLYILPIREGLEVAPDGVLLHPVAHPDGPIGRIALVGTVGVVVGRLQQVHAHVFFGEVVDGTMPGLAEQLGPLAVDNRLAVDHHPHPAGAQVDLDLVIRIPLPPRGLHRLRHDPLPRG